MKKNKKYVVTLRNGETRDVHILDKPLFGCMISGNGSTVFLEREEIIGRKDVISHDPTPFFLWQPYMGAVLNEQAIFDAYKGMRNPVVKIELFTY